MIADDYARRVIKNGTQVVRHGRYITFQLAEVAIPRSLFANILRLIDGLRPAPFRPDPAQSSITSLLDAGSIPSNSWAPQG